MEERRFHPRLALPLQAIIIAGGREHHATIENLSAGGAAATVPAEIAGGTRLVAFCHAEPMAGFARDHVTTIARLGAGGYTLDGNSLKFGMLGSTRMACPQIKDFDLEFNKMISATTRFRITGNKLELFENDKLLASFVAAE